MVMIFSIHLFCLKPDDILASQIAKNKNLNYIKVLVNVLRCLALKVFQ